jgi:hypothetical protein
MSYYRLKRYTPIIAMEEEELIIPMNDEEFISSLPDNLWERVKNQDVAAIREVFSHALDSDYEPDVISRRYIEDVDIDDDNPYYTDRHATFEETN